MENKPNYYFVAVSTKQNLELCIKYGLAGFTNSKNGAWTFIDIKEGDFISFIYGARAYNLYIVRKKIAIENAEKLPPWTNITFKESGKTYYFPFRFELSLIREFNEPIVRYEFAYIAENLLLRGGYAKTHFQADQTTLQNVSSMGKKFDGDIEKLKYTDITKFSPNLTFDRSHVRMPYIYKFEELFLQSIIKNRLSIQGELIKLLKDSNFNDALNINFEALSEKALMQGLVDILLKESVPIGTSKEIVIEIKTNKASLKDVKQVKTYVEEIGNECLGGILVAKDFQNKAVENKGDIKLVKYDFNNFVKDVYTPEELILNLRLVSIT